MMTESEVSQWRPMASAPRDGTRILVALYASEQGPAEVDVARWTKPERAKEACWVASDSDRACVIVYTEAELAYWMPLQSTLPGSPFPHIAPEEPQLRKGQDPERDSEIGGSGI
jgi:hypothetical protein